MPETLVETQLPGYAPEIGASLWRFQDARRRTLRLLQDLPQDFIDRETRGNSIATILYHLALIEADWLFTEILEEPVPPEMEGLFPVDDRDQAGILSLIQGQTLADHLSRLSAVREAFLERIRGMPLEDFHRPRSLPDYEVSPAWVIHHLSQHEAEHRGELGTVIDAFRKDHLGEVS